MERNSIKLSDPWGQHRSRTRRELFLGITEDVAAVFGTTPDEVLNTKRVERNVVLARHTTIRIVKRFWPEMSMPQIAAIFGFNHTTVCYALGTTTRKTKTLPGGKNRRFRASDQVGLPVTE